MSHRLRDFDAIDIVARFMRELQHKPNSNTATGTDPDPNPQAMPSPALACLGPCPPLVSLAPLRGVERALPAIRKATATTTATTTTAGRQTAAPTTTANLNAACLLKADSWSRWSRFWLSLCYE